MLTFDLAAERVGIVGCAVGGAFAVLVAEQLFASGCRLLLSVTSAGRIAADLPEASCFVLIDRALRDEGTSYHYLPAAEPFACANPDFRTCGWAPCGIGFGDPAWSGLDDGCAVP